MSEKDSLSNSQGAMRIGIAIAVVACILVAYKVYASHAASSKLKDDTEALSIVSVATTKPKSDIGESELELPGSVQANYEAPIYARTSGYLKKWYVDIGTPVKAGQVLAEIEAPELDQQLRAAQADRASSEAGQRIAASTAQRWQGLRETGAVSKQDVDEKVSAAEASNAALQAAQANLQRLRELSSFKKIVAPFDGVITARNTDVGQLIVAGSNSGPELFRIADTRQLRLYVRVPQSYAAELMKPDITAQVRFPDRPGATYTAKLDRTANAIDSASRTMLAQLLVENTKSELLTGAYAEVTFKLPAAPATSLRLPANVLLFRGDGLRVATVDGNNKVVMKPIELGRDYGAEVEVIHGLSAEDNVIVSPPDSIMESSPVRIVKPDNASAKS
jgi:RND family efflux transporter MFP subunit